MPNARLLHILATACLLWAAGCGKETQSADPPAVDAGIDMSDAAEPDAGPMFVCPIEGQMYCGEKCVDVVFNIEHCGDCETTCTLGSQTCRDRQCVCRDEMLLCGGSCFNDQTSREHCGECDRTCTSAQACVDGDCVPIADDPNVFGVLVATNEARAQPQDCGVEGMFTSTGEVGLDEVLTVAAQVHAEDMAANRFLGHVGSDDSSPSERAARAGWAGRAVGENVAEGYDTPQEAVAGWIDSDGHCANLMDGGFDVMGVGYAVSPITGQPYWAQVFGER